MKDFEGIGARVGRLVAEKQLAYGDSFGRSGDMLRQLYPKGIKPSQYDDLLTIARILDKLFRIATKKEAFDEDPYEDVVGYGLLGMGRHQGDSPNETQSTEDRSKDGSYLIRTSNECIHKEKQRGQEGLGDTTEERSGSEGPDR